MKELSIEEKAKAYDEALEKLRDFYRDYDTVSCLIDVKEELANLFPELKESEDEKVRKALITYFQRFPYGCIGNAGANPKEAIAWLEKQGHEPRKVSIWKHWKDGICGNGEGKLIYLIKNGDDYSLSSSLGFECDYILLSDLDNLMLDRQGTSYTKRDVDDAYVEGMAFAKDELERQGEQKPVDKVGPKFKVGDWCIDNEDGTIFQIVKVLDNTYTYKTNEGKEYSCSHYSLENDAHLWTIQDARLGDVLACNEEILLFKSYSVQGRISLYCWYNGQTNNFHSKEVVDTLMTTRNKIYPATKKQRDLFFQKMKEAGYEWDAEKKELKKVEKKSQRMISAEAKEAMYDKPTDEDMKEALRTEYEKGRADAIAEIRKRWDDSKKKRQEVISFLESLRLKED